MKNIFILFTLVFMSIHGISQNSLSSIYWNSYSIVNPAFSGFDKPIHSSLNYSYSHFNSSRNRATTHRSSFDVGYKLDKLSSGIGLSYSGYNVTGNYDSEIQWFNLIYNYQFKPSETSKLSFGTSLGMLSYKPEWYYSSDWENNSQKRTSDFNVGFGIMFQADKLMVGLSGTQILTSTSFSTNYIDAKNIWLLASYEFDLNENLKIIPSLNLLGTIGINVRAILKDKYWIGLSHGGSSFSYLYSYSWRSLTPMLGGSIGNKLNLGYSYDKLGYLSRNNHYSYSGIHSVSLFYSID